MVYWKYEYTRVTLVFYFSYILDIHLCAELQQRSHKYILMNFQEVMKTDEFYSLSFEEVSKTLMELVLRISRKVKGERSRRMEKAWKNSRFVYDMLHSDALEGARVDLNIYILPSTSQVAVIDQFQVIERNSVCSICVPELEDRLVNF